jgi:hypothetical protein
MATLPAGGGGDGGGDGGGGGGGGGGSCCSGGTHSPVSALQLHPALNEPSQPKSVDWLVAQSGSIAPHAQPQPSLSLRSLAS